MITVKGLTVVNGMDVTKLTHPSWIWFTLTSTVISLLVMLFSGSLQIKRNVWGETEDSSDVISLADISIHSPRVGRDVSLY